MKTKLMNIISMLKCHLKQNKGVPKMWTWINITQRWRFHTQRVTYQNLTKNLDIGLESTFRVYLISAMMSLDQSMNSRSLLLGDDRSTSYLKSSFTSSRNTVWKPTADWNISTQTAPVFYELLLCDYFRNLTKIQTKCYLAAVKKMEIETKQSGH